VEGEGVWRGGGRGGCIEILCQNLENLIPLLVPLCRADNYTLLQIGGEHTWMKDEHTTLVLFIDRRGKDRRGVGIFPVTFFLRTTTTSNKCEILKNLKVCK
jgi:hypothetical protein